MQTGEAIRLTNISEKCPKDADLKAWFAAKSDEDLFKVQRVEVDLTDLDLPESLSRFVGVNFAVNKLPMDAK